MELNEVDSRVRQNYPALLMMLVSLIVALVFENLVGAIAAREVLWDGTPESWFFWIQCLGMLVGPLTYWFGLSLHSSAVRTVFSPRDTVASILAAITFNGLVAGIGAENAVPWLYGFGVLFPLAWIAFRQYGRVYEDDPLIQGNTGTHRVSGRWMLVGGAVVLAAAALVHTGNIGLFWAGVVVLFGLGAGIYAHVCWFREWKLATGVAERPR